MQVKTCKDYYEEMYKLFPDVPKKDIQKILSLGWKTLYLYNSMGADVVIKDKKFWSYIGYLKSDSLEYFKYYLKKLSIKFRILYKRLKIKWDGYYYFALQPSQYEKIINQQKSKGRKRKYFTFENIKLYQILDECKVEENSAPYIFKVALPVNLGFKVFKKELKTDKAELIIERKPLTFKDVLINENDYDLL